MFQFFSSPFFHFEFVRVLGTVPFGGAEVAECLQAAEEIRNDDPESWYQAWWSAGERAEKLALEAQAKNDRESARWAFFRASNYFRSSELILHVNPNDPRLLPALERSGENFRKGIPLLDGGVHFLEVPYEGKKLPAYLYLPPAERRVGNTIPIILNSGGFDCTQEEMYYYVAAGATARGYAVLTFEGPGQGIVARRDKLFMRPDWEVVTGCVLDSLWAFSGDHPELALDLNRVAIAGSSMGGYFALRGAADPRIKACISYDGFYDLGDIIKSRFIPWLVKPWFAGYLSDGMLNGTINLLSGLSLQMRWEITHGMVAMGQNSPADLMREWVKYTLKPEGDNYLQKIRCPVFATGAAASLYFTPEENTLKIFEQLTQLNDSQKETWIAKDIGEGGMQAKVGALSIAHQRTFAWLDPHFGMHRESIASKDT
ncbi:hypothetical protein GP486_001018 [Trichoglossum hirsutum]|uniref:AB hydrolase-1 domain-containing protein n=1 Tax=Trichoglossum hirsutum TaxID=265104 RepID=A0A9P8LGQ9_9PEZI|nr:hypothetical protein GP486_001018 [Trichoglossum hirsutum]